jgi:DNA repair protein RecN (Recombination protein N)
MLVELRIRNFALIDDLTVDLGPGLIAITGETGAGKSIIIDALNAALGERVGADSIRGGAEAAHVEAVFDLTDAPLARRAADEAGVAIEGNRLTLNRTIAEGRSHYRINDAGSSLATLRAIGEHLADIHGQHDHQQLIHEDSHLRFLDAHGGAGHERLLDAYAEAWQELRQARAALERLNLDERTRAQRLDLLRFQVEEINAAALAENEDDDLASERERLMHVEKLREGVSDARQALVPEDDDAGAVQDLRVAAATIGDLAEVDGTLAPVATALQEATALVEEAGRSLRDYLEQLEADPARIEQVEARLHMIAGLRRKYGDSVQAILAHCEAAAAEVEELESAEFNAEKLQARLAELVAQAGLAAHELSIARRKLAEKLSARVVRELQPLGMENARFEVQIESDADETGLPDAEGRRWTADASGIDLVRFLLGANVGEPLRPLSKVASGGELSRLMLAIKSISAGASQTPTLVFDEVDVNIGGRTAYAVADKLVAVSGDAQVLCITHLAQIACMADRQISVSKSVRDGRTVVQAEELDEDGRVTELARMMGGTEDATSAREHAAEMLAEAQEQRQTTRGV